MSKRRVLIVLHNLAHYRKDFLRNLIDSNTDKEIFIITAMPHGKKVNAIIEDNSINYIRLPIKEYNFLGFSFKWMSGLLPQARMFQPDVISILYNAGIINYTLLLLISKISSVPFILWGCGYKRIGLTGIRLKIKNIYKQLFLKQATALITYGSKYYLELLSEGYDRRRLFIAQNTIDVERIMIKYPNAVNERACGKITNILFVGALIKGKNLIESLSSIEKLYDLGYKFRFDIVGEGEIRNRLEELVSSNIKLQKCVFVKGAVYNEALEEYFLNAHLFFLPGTGGLALNEAMAYGLPLVSTEADGTGLDLLENEENGFLIDYSDESKSALNCLINFLNLTDVEKLNMGKRSVEILKERATLKNMVQKYSLAIDFALGNRIPKN